MKKFLTALMLGGFLTMTMTSATVDAAKIPNSAGTDATSTIKVKKLNLTTEWDKFFPKSDKVDHKKVTFVNRYGITLAADMYTPKNAKGKLPAIAISGPFGAVKEQSSGLYAQEMAERGFLTIAFDPSYTGESGGYRHQNQSHRHNHDVRYEPRHGEWLFRLRQGRRNFEG